MSHYSTIVFIRQLEDNDTEDFRGYIEQGVSKLLAPYDENLEVDPYEEACSCVGVDARLDAHKSAELEFGKTLNELRDEYAAMPPEGRVEWDVFISGFLKIREKYEEEHPLKGLPTPDCEDCGGSGKVMTTYNPKSVWDWYVIGGRWSGVMEVVVPGSVVGPDIVPAYLVPQDFTPYACVTPDGEWKSKGRMGWFGVSFDTKPQEEWAEEFRGYCEEYKDCTAVLCDLHI